MYKLNKNPSTNTILYACYIWYKYKKWKKWEDLQSISIVVVEADSSIPKVNLGGFLNLFQSRKDSYFHKRMTIATSTTTIGIK